MTTMPVQKLQMPEDVENIPKKRGRKPNSIINPDSPISTKKHKDVVYPEEMTKALLIATNEIHASSFGETVRRFINRHLFLRTLLLIAPNAILTVHNPDLPPDHPDFVMMKVKLEAYAN